MRLSIAFIAAIAQINTHPIVAGAHLTQLFRVVRNLACDDS